MLHLNGIHAPSHGTVRIGGRAVDRSTVKRDPGRGRARLPGPRRPAVQPDGVRGRRVRPDPHGLPADEVHDRVERALAAVGMTGFERRIPHRLSLGQRKRVALATVLSMDPSVLVFDEPSAGLDPRGRRELIGLLRALTQTLLVSTHDMRLVAEVFPRTVVMDDGRIVADGPTGRLLADERSCRRTGSSGPVLTVRRSDTTSAGSSAHWRQIEVVLPMRRPAARVAHPVEQARPVARPTSTTGKWRILPVWISVSASNSSSSVPKPPGKITKASAYFTNIVLRTKK